MTQTDVSRLLRAAAGAADELSVRLRMIEEARLRMPVEVAVHAVDAATGDVAGADTIAIAFEVLMQATKGARDDLKAIMDGVTAVNRARDALRQGMNDAAPGSATSPCPPACAFDLDAVLLVLLTAYNLDLDREMDGLSSELDSTAEIGELLSLELQMAMDRRSRMLVALANLMKKLADTGNQIVQNLK